MSKPENPSAFPVSKETALDPVTNLLGDDLTSGMRLRDWFAGQALAGVCARADIWGIPTAEKMCVVAYELADAMLAERERGQ